MRRRVGDARVRILLADDEEAPLLVVREYLLCCGWEVDAVRTPDEARSLLESRGYYNPEVEAQARRLGVDAFVPKPVPLWELARLVQGWAVASQPLRS